MTVIAQMLDGLRDEKGRERFAFKGGAALELRFGHRARDSKDVDGAYRGDVEECRQLVAEAVGRGWSEFTGTVSDGELITNTGLARPPLRFRVKLFYKGKEFMTLPFEVSEAEGRSLESVERLRPAVSLRPVQLPDTEEIPFLPIAYQIAQKLHACTEDLGDERANDRARDLVDLLLIEELAVTSEMYAEIREACVETFAIRGKHDWPPTIVIWPGWELLWERLAEEEGIEFSVAEAAERVQQLVKQLDEAV